jgi:hypothetical protein
MLMDVWDGSAVRRLYLLLGLTESASLEDVKAAYKSLMESLDQKHFMRATPGAEQAARCRKVLEHVYKHDQDRGFALSEEDSAQVEGPDQQTRPRLGQLCVASGMISMEQLQEAVDAQVKERLPLGEILQAKRFISQAELDGLLLGQEIIDVPSACTDPFGKRLISFELVTEEMILIAQMEQKGMGASVGESVASHGWVAPEVLRALGSPVPHETVLKGRFKTLETDL